MWPSELKAESENSHNNQHIKYICYMALQLSMTVSKAPIYIDLDFTQLFHQFYKECGINSPIPTAELCQDNS